MTTPDAGPFAARLREWRRLRRLSQLHLASAAGTTPRHLSFLETGRSRPSRAMVTRLAAVLQLSPRAHNDLLTAAGHAPHHPESGWDSADLVPFRAAVDRLLAGHDPFPALVVDGRWDVVDTNDAGARLIGEAERNLVRLLYGGAWRASIENWAALAPVGLRRLEDDLQRHPGDPVLRELVQLAADATAGVGAGPAAADDAVGAVLCPHFRFGDRVVRTLSVVARFGSPRDVTLDELRVELIYPADTEAEEFFHLASTASAP